MLEKYQGLESHYAILNIHILNNSLLNWIIFFSLALVMCTILITMKIFIVRRAVHHMEVVNFFRSLKIPFLGVFSFYVASFTLCLHPVPKNILTYGFTFILFIQFLILINFFVQRTMHHLLIKDAHDPNNVRNYFISFFLKVACYSIVLIVLLSNLGVNVTGLVTGLGIGGIAIALGVQNILSDLFASLSILFDKTFEIGDYIVVDASMGCSGFVEQIGLKTVRLKGENGEEWIVPNSSLMQSKLRNYKKDRLRKVKINISIDLLNKEQLTGLQIPEELANAVESTPYAQLVGIDLLSYEDPIYNFEVTYQIESQGKSFIDEFMDMKKVMDWKLLKVFAQKGAKVKSIKSLPA